MTFKAAVEAAAEFATVLLAEETRFKAFLCRKPN